MRNITIERISSKNPYQGFLLDVLKETDLQLSLTNNFKSLGNR